MGQLPNPKPPDMHNTTRAAFTVFWSWASPWTLHACAATGVALSLTWSPLGAHAQAAAAGTAYRCVQSSGAVSYSQFPCVSSGTRTASVTVTGERIAVNDTRHADQIRQSVQAHQREAALARRQSRERQHQERLAAQVPAKALTVSVPHKPSTVRSAAIKAPAQTHKLPRQRHFRALVPKTPQVSPSPSATPAAGRAPGTQTATRSGQVVGR